MLEEILIYFGFIKITGTKLVSFWKKPYGDFLIKKKYDKNSPFYILKKLQ